LGETIEKRVGITTADRRFKDGRHHFFLAFFDGLKDSQINTNWLAMKMDEYVPTTTPTSRIKAKSLITDPPNK
jgi:hypothetical protein